MAPKRFDKLDAERQAALLDAATRELAAHGPEHASLNRILARVGLSKGVAYYYFDGREDLFRTVVVRLIDLAARQIGAPGPIDSADAFWGEFRALGERTLGFLRDHPHVATIAKRFLASPRAMRARPIVARYDAFHHWFAGFIRRGQEVGAVRTDVPIELLVALAFAWGEALDRWTLAHWDEVARSASSLSAHLDVAMRLFRDAFEPGKTRTR